MRRLTFLLATVPLLVLSASALAVPATSAQRSGPAAKAALGGQWFAGSVSAVGTGSLTLGVLWTGPHDGALNGQTLTLTVGPGARISSGSHHTPIALGQVATSELVAVRASGSSSSQLTASAIHVYCNCHWIGGTIGSINPSGTSFTVQVSRTGPYDGVLNTQSVTIQTGANTVYLRGSHRARVAFSDLQIGQGVGVVFSASGFFKAPGFDASTATFTAARVHVWAHRQVPPPSSDAASAAQTSTS